MRRVLMTGLVGVVLVAIATPVAALRIAIPQSMAQRIGSHDAVVAGKVTKIEAKTVKAERFANDKEGGEYMIAVVKISEGFLGTQGLTHIRVAFPPAPPQVPVVPDQPGGIRPHIRPIRRFQPPKLEQDQEAILLLQKHHKENFYVLQAATDVVDKKSPEYAKAAGELTKIGKVLSDPMAALKAKDAGERFQAVSALLLRYRTQRPGATKLEAIPAEESKLILQTLAEADWTPKPIRFGEPNPQMLFNQLGLQPKDGWIQPANFQELPAAQQKWLKDNASTFKLTRYVANTSEK
jgi:hypothetical protein